MFAVRKHYELNPGENCLARLSSGQSEWAERGGWPGGWAGLDWRLFWRQLSSAQLRCQAAPAPPQHNREITEHASGARGLRMAGPSGQILGLLMLILPTIKETEDPLGLILSLSTII